MHSLFQINECLNLSTGRIAQQIGEKAMSRGWNSWIAYSGREPFIETKSQIIKVGNVYDACLHYAGQRLFDNEGLLSKKYTKGLIKHIKDINPDIIQLHNIHDHWLNYPLLFEYLASIKTPIVWVQHDCWSFTGGCFYFDMFNCKRWKDGCYDCPDKRNLFINQSKRNWRLKEDLLSKINNLAFVCVSGWLLDLMKESFLKDRPIYTIHNGTDLDVFRPLNSKRKDGKFYVLGVAALWDARKGLDDFIELRKRLSSDFEITLVGLSKKQISGLPEGIKGISRTSNVQELVSLYNEANVFVNPTYSDNFPTTNIEALACGTPVITYDTGGSPEAVDDKTGVVINQGDVETLSQAVCELRKNPLDRKACRKRAIENFDKNKCFERYFDLYKELIG